MRVFVSICCVASILVSQGNGQSLGFFGEVHGEGSPGVIPHGDFMAHMPGGHHGVELVGHPHPRDLAPHHAVPFPPPPHPAPGMFGLSRV